MSDEDKEEKAFVVKDRRRFDSDGNEKSEGSNKAVERAVKENNHPEQTTKSKMDTIANEERLSSSLNKSSSSNEEIDFSSFIMSLATQVLMQLGEIKPPPGVAIDIDKAAAKQSIEILGMLQNKTKGNLDANETHLLEQILHNLRLSFVKAAK
jgi:Domain of unknown function (DUF1844)